MKTREIADKLGVSMQHARRLAKANDPRLDPLRHDARNRVACQRVAEKVRTLANSLSAQARGMDLYLSSEPHRPDDCNERISAEMVKLRQTVSTLGTIAADLDA